MKIRRWSVAGLATAALLVPALTACDPLATDSAAPGPSQTPTVPSDPKAALVASTKEISKGNFRFTITGDGLDGKGAVHMPSHSAQLQMTVSHDDFSMQMEYIYIEPDSWVKVDLGEMAALPGMEKFGSDKYLHLDQSKVKNLDNMGLNLDKIDPAGSEALIKAIVDVRQNGEGVYTGKIDLSKATDADLVDKDVVKALGTQASTVPFEAKLDAQGRLTEFTVQIPAIGAIKAHELKVTYFDYGSASAAQKPPASKVTEAPAETYQMLG